MASFGKALKSARTAKKATLREVGQHIKKSIGYISDIEHDRKRPPNLETVGNIEDFLGIEDGSLIKLARKIRQTFSSDLVKNIRTNPKLSTVLLRAEKLPEEKLDELLEAINKMEGKE